MVLLHICCAPCTIYPLKQLRKKFAVIKGFFYNPNIHPYREFRNRLKAVEELAEIENLEIIYEKNYGLKEFLNHISPFYDYPKRCERCYSLRLAYTAKLAKELNAEAFTTTMLYSPYQIHFLLKELGMLYEKIYKVPFYYEDFRIGFKEGQEMSIKLNLYRQSYCGCIFSEEERYNKKKRKEVAKKWRELVKKEIKEEQI